MNVREGLANNETCLPPTLNIEPSPSQIGAIAYAHVSYFLDAYAVVDGLVSLSARKQVFLEDDNPSIPPTIPTDDFPGETAALRANEYPGSCLEGEHSRWMYLNPIP